MRKNIIDTKWVLGVLALAVFCLPACNRELDVQTAFPFTIEALPVQKEIVQGQTAEIRCTLNRTGNFADTHYTIRSPLTRDNFRLYYTSRSAERQSIDIYIEDNFGQMKQLSFDFNSETLKE